MELFQNSILFFLAIMFMGRFFTSKNTDDVLLSLNSYLMTWMWNRVWRKVSKWSILASSKMMYPRVLLRAVQGLYLDSCLKARIPSISCTLRCIRRHLYEGLDAVFDQKLLSVDSGSPVWYFTSAYVWMFIGIRNTRMWMGSLNIWMQQGISMCDAIDIYLAYSW